MEEKVNVKIVVMHPQHGFGEFIIMNQESVDQVAAEVRSQGLIILEIDEATAAEVAAAVDPDEE